MAKSNSDATTTDHKLAVFAVKVERTEGWQGWVVAHNADCARERALSHVGAGDENDETIRLEWMDCIGVNTTVWDADERCWYCGGDLNGADACQHRRIGNLLKRKHIRQLTDDWSEACHPEQCRYCTDGEAGRVVG